MWLAAANRKLQAEYIGLLKHKDIFEYKLSETAAGVDSILVHRLPYPDFDDIEALKKLIAKEFKQFTESVLLLI